MISLALITQMRAGTHYMCGGLRVAWAATVYRPVSGGRFVVMDDAEIVKGLHQNSMQVFPPTRPERRIYLSHYYHIDHHRHCDLRKMYLIGFPFDSFYSDGIVYSGETYDTAPSGTREYAQDYEFKFGSREWNFLFERMRQNADWLMRIEDGPGRMVMRYEDFFLDFGGSCERVSRFVGGLVHPMPKPVMNRRRFYWSGDISSGFDLPARRALWELFGPAIERFYPERIPIVSQLL